MTIPQSRILPSLCIALASSAQGASFVNGSFETPEFVQGLADSDIGDPGQYHVFRGNVIPIGWDIFTNTGRLDVVDPHGATVSSPDWVTRHYELFAPFVTDGDAALFLDSYNTFYIGGPFEFPGYQAGISQVLTGLIPGEKYEISFDAAAVRYSYYFSGSGPNNAAALPGLLDVYIGDSSTPFESLTLDDLRIRVDYGDGLFTQILSGDMQTYTYGFTATSDTLFFGVRSRVNSAVPGDIGYSTFQAAVDNFSLLFVPEPSRALLIACAGLPLFRPRRRG